jgi:hypothetical protein
VKCSLPDPTTAPRFRNSASFICNRKASAYLKTGKMYCLHMTCTDRWWEITLLFSYWSGVQAKAVDKNITLPVTKYQQCNRINQCTRPNRVNVFGTYITLLGGCVGVLSIQDRQTTAMLGMDQRLWRTHTNSNAFLPSTNHEWHRIITRADALSYGTMLITQRNSIFLEKLAVTPPNYGNQKFIIVLTTARHLCICCAN